MEKLNLSDCDLLIQKIEQGYYLTLNWKYGDKFPLSLFVKSISMKELSWCKSSASVFNIYNQDLWRDYEVFRRLPWNN